MAQIEGRLSRSLAGFQLSENKAAKHLTIELGVQFTQLPPVVELNFQNRLRRAKDGGIGGVIAGVVMKGAIAVYDRRYGAVFVPKEDLFSELHEDGHALVDSINPEIRDAVDELPVMVKQRINGQSVKTGKVERIVSFRCFDEGVAQWGALRTAMGLTEIFDIENVTEMERTMTQGVEEQFRNIRQAVSAYEIALAQTGPKVMIEGMKAESQLSDPKYVVGYHFVDGAMRTLIDSGRQIGEALMGLIRKPPEKIDDLERPQEYLTRVKL